MKRAILMMIAVVVFGCANHRQARRHSALHEIAADILTTNVFCQAEQRVEPSLAEHGVRANNVEDFPEFGVLDGAWSLVFGDKSFQQLSGGLVVREQPQLLVKRLNCCHRLLLVQKAECAQVIHVAAGLAPGFYIIEPA
jgi:hypothetical protein